MSEASPASGATNHRKYEAVKNGLIQRMRNKRYKAGDRIPPQVALEREFGVSRITIRRATADLMAAGFLEHRPGRRGVFVADRTGVESRPRAIAVAIDDVTDRFGSTILRGIEDYLWEKKYFTIVCNADRDFGKVEGYFASFDYDTIEGVVFAPVIDVGFQQRNTRIARLLERKSMPFVVVDRRIEGVQANSVTTNHRESAGRLTAALLASGHQRILLARGIECSSVAERVAGFRDAHGNAGVELDENLILTMNDNALYPEAGAEQVTAMARRIQHAGEFTAFYALNNRLLNAGIRSMQTLRMQLESIQFALHNEVSKPIHPFSDRIPRVIPPLYRMGWLAARALLDTIGDGGSTVSQIVLENDIKFENLVE